MNGPFGLGHGAGTAEQTNQQDSGPMESLVQQLHALYEEKQELQGELGVSTASEILELFATHRNDGLVKSLVDQLFTLYMEREALEQAIGCSGDSEVIALVTELRTSIRNLVDDSRRRLAYEASLLETHERFLS
jgi:hypothetical protein